MLLRICLSVTLFALLLPACGGDDAPKPTPAPATTATPTEINGVKVHPPGTRTGRPSIDAALDAIEKGDAALLTSQLAVVAIGCSSQTVEGLACGPGEAEGTKHDIIVYNRCQLGQSQVVLRSKAAPDVAAFVASRPSGLWAVANMGTSPYYGPYGIAFASGHLVLLDETGITAFLPPCPGIMPMPPPIGPRYILAPP